MPNEYFSNPYSGLIKWGVEMPGTQSMVPAPRSKFDGFLPQGGEMAAIERRQSFDKAKLEAVVRAEERSREIDEALRQKDWLTKFKRVWE